MAKRKTRRRNPQSTAAKPKPRTNPTRRSRKRGGHRAKTHTRRKSTRRRNNPATNRRSLLRMKNPASGANISVGGILGTVVVLGLANSLVNKATANQSPVASAGIKIGAGFGLAKWGKKIPFLGNYAGLAGLVLIILGGQDLFNQYITPKLASVPLIGSVLGGGSSVPLQALPTDTGTGTGVGRLVSYNPRGVGRLVSTAPELYQ